jgi:hypothetical protein
MPPWIIALHRFFEAFGWNRRRPGAGGCVVEHQPESQNKTPGKPPL